MLPTEAAAFERLLSAGVRSDALLFYGRWLQLETWLREVAYVELRAKYGMQWTQHLGGTAPKRAASDARNSYMASADAGDLLAYADVSHLFQLIEDRWELFEPLLPPQRRWQGLTDELRDLRNRNAHCRRPHRDDVSRIEQALRDLELGAQRFYVSYLDTRPLQASRDPVARAWIKQRHAAAARLIAHAERQYEVRFRLGYSVRPWCAWPREDHITGTPGVLWHAKWILGPNQLTIADLWDERSQRAKPADDLVVHLLVDFTSVTATFAAIDPADQVANAIGEVFDDILTATTRTRHDYFGLTTEDSLNHWRAGAVELPARAQIESPLTDVDPLNPRDLSIFKA
jgi:hypothetical protein